MSGTSDDDYWDSIGIAQVSKILHIPQSALRYYEKEGLVSPARTENSSYRQYSLLSLVELGDIALYRNIGVPVKEIKCLMQQPASETALAIDRAIDKTAKQMRDLSEKLEKLSLYNQRIREFYRAKSHGSQFVSTPEISAAYPFGIKDEASLQAYVNDLATNYCVYYESAFAPETYVDCSLVPTPGMDEKPLWQVDKTPNEKNSNCLDRSYYECLIRTDYCYAQHNNISEHVEHLKSMGLTPGHVIARYLTFEYSENDDKRYDYYLAWIQIIGKAAD